MIAGVQGIILVLACRTIGCTLGFRIGISLHVTLLQFVVGLIANPCHGGAQIAECLGHRLLRLQIAQIVFDRCQVMAKFVAPGIRQRFQFFDRRGGREAAAHTEAGKTRGGYGENSQTCCSDRQLRGQTHDNTEV